MAAILKWPKHQMVSCDRFPDLGGCSVCGGWEGEVPTDCPGAEMTDGQKDGVLRGKLDYFWREGWSSVTRIQRLRVKMICEGDR